MVRAGISCKRFMFCTTFDFKSKVLDFCDKFFGSYPYRIKHFSAAEDFKSKVAEVEFSGNFSTADKDEAASADDLKKVPVIKLNVLTNKLRREISLFI